jgi:hypothetical protein
LSAQLGSGAIASVAVVFAAAVSYNFGLITSFRKRASIVRSKQRNVAQWKTLREQKQEQLFVNEDRQVNADKLLVGGVCCRRSGEAAEEARENRGESRNKAKQDTEEKVNRKGNALK